MNGRMTPAALQAELDDVDSGPFAEFRVLWSGLADALWLGTLRAVLEPSAAGWAADARRAPAAIERRERAA